MWFCFSISLSKKKKFMKSVRKPFTSQLKMLRPDFVKKKKCELNVIASIVSYHQSCNKICSNCKIAHYYYCCCCFLRGIKAYEMHAESRSIKILSNQMCFPVSNSSLGTLELKFFKRPPSSLLNTCA